VRYELRTEGEYTDLFCVEDDGSEACLGNDRGEPEDNLFARDWDWVPVELNRLASEIRTLREEKERLLALFRDAVIKVIQIRDKAENEDAPSLEVKP
jgi:hypothetical protein